VRSSALALAKPEPLGVLLSARERAEALLAEANRAVAQDRLADALRHFAEIAALPGQYRYPAVIELRRRLITQCTRGRLFGIGLHQALERHSQRVGSLATSSDGHLLLSGGLDGLLLLWDVPRGEPVMSRELNQNGQFTGICAVAMDDAARIAIAGGTDGSLRVLDLAAGAWAKWFKLGRENVTAVAISRDGRLALAACDDWTVRVLDIETGQRRRRFLGFAGPVTTLAFDPTGRFALDGSTDRTLRIWEIDTGRRIKHLTGHAAELLAAVFSPDGHWISSVSADGNIRHWDVDSGRSIRSCAGSGLIRSAAFSADGALLMTARADREVRLQSVDDGAVLRALQEESGDVGAVALSADCWVAFSTSGARIRAWHFDWELVEKGRATAPA
jgi:WD40 repeat protein